MMYAEIKREAINVGEEYAQTIVNELSEVLIKKRLDFIEKKWKHNDIDEETFIGMREFLLNLTISEGWEEQKKEMLEDMKNMFIHIANKTAIAILFMEQNIVNDGKY